MRTRYVAIGTQVFAEYKTEGGREFTCSNCGIRRKYVYCYKRKKVQFCQSCYNILRKPREAETKKPMAQEKIMGFGTGLEYHEWNMDRVVKCSMCQRCYLERTYYSKYGKTICKRCFERWETSKVKTDTSIDPKIDKVTGKVKINVSDVLIRKSCFKCMNSRHELLDLNGEVSVLQRRTSNIKTVKIPITYCATCNKYYVLESVFLKLLLQGIPLCAVSDSDLEKESEYWGTGEMWLASESVLMKYGYTVSKKEALPPTTRQRLLAILVDNGIITKAGIISYLDFFIAARKDKAEYYDAINKWKDDREFIVNYQINAKAEVNITGIYR